MVRYKVRYILPVQKEDEVPAENFEEVKQFIRNKEQEDAIEFLEIREDE